MGFPVLFLFLILPTFGLSQDPFAGIGGQDPRQRFSSNYIFPNEREFYFFDKPLSESSDALISVGTYRSIEAASRGNFSALVMMDYDAQIVAFNRVQIEALKAAKSRGDFLARFVKDESIAEVLEENIRQGNWSSVNRIIGESRAIELAQQASFEEEEKLLKAASEGVFNREKAARLAKIYNRPDLTNVIFKSLSETISNAGTDSSIYRSLVHSLGKTLMDHEVFDDLTERGIDSHRKIYVAAMLRFTENANPIKNGFLASDERFGRVRRLAQEGKMFAVQGSLFGKEMEEIGERLRKSGIEVGVIDVSNAPDYFLQRGGRLENLAEVVKQYKRNLKALPLNKSAKVHFTTEIRRDRSVMGLWDQHIGRRKPFGGWHYHSVPIQTYLEKIGTESYRDLIEGRKLGPSFLNTDCSRSFEALQVYGSR